MLAGFCTVQRSVSGHTSAFWRTLLNQLLNMCCTRHDLSCFKMFWPFYILRITSHGLWISWWFNRMWDDPACPSSQTSSCVYKVYKSPDIVQYVVQVVSFSQAVEEKQPTYGKDIGLYIIGLTILWWYFELSYCYNMKMSLRETQKIFII